MSLTLTHFWNRLFGKETDALVQTTRDEVHQTLNQVQRDVSHARVLLDKENYRHSQSLEKAKQDLDSVAERIARAIGS